MLVKTALIRFRFRAVGTNDGCFDPTNEVQDWPGIPDHPRVANAGSHLF